MKELFIQYKNLLFTLAYQLTGSAADAEDIVQDVFVKIHDVGLEQVKEPKAYLCKMVTNRCMDLHKSARKRREHYVGPWLPEPIVSAEEDTFESVVRQDLLSYAMLVLLERLSPSERAVFILREALCFDYSDIARLLGKSEAACRKLLSRARNQMGITQNEVIHAEEAGVDWVRRFLTELERGNVDHIVTLLAEDVTIVSDGGGKVFAASHPIKLIDRVVPFLLGLVRQSKQAKTAYQFELAPINGQVGLVIRLNEEIDTVALVNVEEGKLKNLYLIRNPDKLAFVQNSVQDY
jgi:RNA polymerase sigma-70 factor (TIGR02957 family)